MQKLHTISPEPLAKLTKAEVDYEHPAKGMDHCSDCKHFEAPDGCKIVQGTISKNDWCKKFEEKKMAEGHAGKHAHHGFTHSTMEHHHDGSGTVEHHHHEGAHKNIKHAVANLDGLHDSIQDHLGTPNPGEAAADAGQHGVPPAVAGPAGLPAPAVPGAGA